MSTLFGNEKSFLPILPIIFALLHSETGDTSPELPALPGPLLSSSLSCNEKKSVPSGFSFRDLSDFSKLRSLRDFSDVGDQSDCRCLGSPSLPRSSFLIENRLFDLSNVLTEWEAISSLRMMNSLNCAYSFCVINPCDLNKAIKTKSLVSWLSIVLKRENHSSSVRSSMERRLLEFGE